MFSCVRVALVAGFVGIVTCGHAIAQALTVAPVTIHMVPGQMATSLTVTNESDSETAFQLRAFAWGQDGDDDRLLPTDQILASPPIGSIAAGASQVVRIVLRRQAQDRETSFRIIFDQIPPPAKAGTVRLALRLSIPIFAEPASPIASQLHWRIERANGRAYLIGVNNGNEHERVRNIALAGTAGSVLKADDNQSPYILAGATRHWRLVGNGVLPGLDAVFHLTAQGDASPVDTSVSVTK
jgi:fimbrial chaperone protein